MEYLHVTLAIAYEKNVYVYCSVEKKKEKWINEGFEK